jgi:hypothetical protein
MTAVLKGLVSAIAVSAIVTVLYVIAIVFGASTKHVGGVSFDLSLLTRSPIYWILLAAGSVLGFYFAFSRRSV